MRGRNALGKLYAKKNHRQSNISDFLDSGYIKFVMLICGEIIHFHLNPPISSNFN